MQGESTRLVAQVAQSGIKPVTKSLSGLQPEHTFEKATYASLIRLHTCHMDAVFAKRGQLS